MTRGPDPLWLGIIWALAFSAPLYLALALLVLWKTSR